MPGTFLSAAAVVALFPVLPTPRSPRRPWEAGFFASVPLGLVVVFNVHGDDET